MSDKPQLFLFLSVDIIGSTAKKYGKKSSDSAGSEDFDWYSVFTDFYISFPDEFRTHLEAEYEYNGKLEYSKRTLVTWKYAGDEILFYAEIKQENEVPCVISAFKKTLEDWYSAKDKLEVKGCAWIGQFPFIDRKVKKNGDKPDFIGPSIDCGFRLGKYASKEEVVISVEVADLLNGISCLQSSLYYLKSENLKGVLGDTRYPIFVLKLDGAKTDEYDFLKSSCRIKDLDEYIKKYYLNVGEKFPKKVSRIEKDVRSYLAGKKELCKQIKTSKIAVQQSAQEIDKDKKGSDVEFEQFEALFGSSPDSTTGFESF